VVLAWLPVLSLVGMMMDYMLPKKIMSWKEAWEMYFEEQGGALFDDLARYGIRPPLHADIAMKEKDRISHEVWAIFYQYTHAAAFHTWDIDDEHMAWLSEQYPDTFDKFYRRASTCGSRWPPTATASTTWRLPQLCQVCQIPMGFTEPDDPTTICFRSRTTTATATTSAATAAVHLRPRAGEVRPGLAAGAPDLPGQLRRGRDPRRAQVVPPQHGRRQHGLRGLARGALWNEWMADRRGE
jgi:hypothetical protein